MLGPSAVSRSAATASSTRTTPAMTETRSTRTRTNNCEVARCGDGFLRDDLAQDAPGYEACDDSNAENTDGCLTTCALARCGDGFVRDGEEACDDGDGNDETPAATTARSPPAATACAVRTSVSSRRATRLATTVTRPIRTSAPTRGTVALRRLDRARRPRRGRAGLRVPVMTATKPMTTAVWCRALAACGDGFVQAGVEACDDGNQDNTDACVGNCRACMRRWIYPSWR